MYDIVSRFGRKRRRFFCAAPFGGRVSSLARRECRVTRAYADANWFDPMSVGCMGGSMYVSGRS